MQIRCAITASISFLIFILMTTMKSVVSIPSRGKGVFALRKSLKLAKGTIYDLRRNHDNPHGQNVHIR
jgi:hypothetical protein